MRTYSTPQSALNLEITKLAIVECVLAVLLYVGAGIYFGTFKYLAAAVVFAPLMLFRTEASANWGLGLYSRVFLRLMNMRYPLDMIAFLSLAPLIGPTIRIVGTLLWATRRPLYTLREAPRNWLRQTICTDFAHVPEIVPLDAVKGEDYQLPTFKIFTGFYREQEGVQKILAILVFLPFLVIGWLPSFIYRVSFKATCVVYSPLIWVTHLTLQNPLPLKARLERITKGELEKVRRWLSYVIFGGVIVKLALMLGWVDLKYFQSWFPSSKIADSFVMADRWPWWQFTLTTEAALTFFLFYFADAAITRIENQQTWSESGVLNVVTSASFLRAVLSIVTITYFFYLALLVAFPNFAGRFH
jgi:hypothetical protein